jgi:hypothetical protein
MLVAEVLKEVVAGGFGGLQVFKFPLSAVGIVVSFSVLEGDGDGSVAEGCALEV